MLKKEFAKRMAIAALSAAMAVGVTPATVGLTAFAAETTGVETVAMSTEVNAAEGSRSVGAVKEAITNIVNEFTEEVKDIKNGDSAETQIKKALATLEVKTPEGNSIAQMNGWSDFKNDANGFSFVVSYSGEDDAENQKYVVKHTYSHDQLDSVVKEKLDQFFETHTFYRVSGESYRLNTSDVAKIVSDELGYTFVKAGDTNTADKDATSLNGSLTIADKYTYKYTAQIKYRKPIADVLKEAAETLNGKEYFDADTNTHGYKEYVYTSDATYTGKTTANDDEVLIGRIKSDINQILNSEGYDDIDVNELKLEAVDKDGEKIASLGKKIPATHASNGKLYLTVSYKEATVNLDDIFYVNLKHSDDQKLDEASSKVLNVALPSKTTTENYKGVTIDSYTIGSSLSKEIQPSSDKAASADDVKKVVESYVNKKAEETEIDEKTDNVKYSVKVEGVKANTENDGVFYVTISATTPNDWYISDRAADKDAKVNVEEKSISKTVAVHLSKIKGVKAVTLDIGPDVTIRFHKLLRDGLTLPVTLTAQDGSESNQENIAWRSSNPDVAQLDVFNADGTLSKDAVRYNIDGQGYIFYRGIHNNKFTSGKLKSGTTVISARTADINDPVTGDTKSTDNNATNNQNHPNTPDLGLVDTMTLTVIDGFKDNQVKSAWYYDAIKWAEENDLSDGVDNVNFGREQNVTRAEFLQWLYKVALKVDGNKVSEDIKKANVSFTDVNDEWYSTAVKWAVGAGVVSGYGDGTFKPEQEITRAEAVTMMWNYIAKPDYEGIYDFVDVPNTWYTKAVNWASSNGVTAGTDSQHTHFAPDATATRQEAIQFIYNYFGGKL